MMWVFRMYLLVWLCPADWSLRSLSCISYDGFAVYFCVVALEVIQAQKVVACQGEVGVWLWRFLLPCIRLSHSWESPCTFFRNCSGSRMVTLPSLCKQANKIYIRLKLGVIENLPISSWFIAQQKFGFLEIKTTWDFMPFVFLWTTQTIELQHTHGNGSCSNQ